MATGKFIIQTNYLPKTRYASGTNNSSRYKSDVLINFGPKFVFAWFVWQTSEVDYPSLNLYLDGKRRQISAQFDLSSPPYLFIRKVSWDIMLKNQTKSQNRPEPNQVSKKQLNREEKQSLPVQNKASCVKCHRTNVWLLNFWYSY